MTRAASPARAAELAAAAPAVAPAPGLAELLAAATPVELAAGPRLAGGAPPPAGYAVPLPDGAYLRISARAHAALHLHAAGADLDDAAAATRGGAADWDGARLGRIRERLLARAGAPAAPRDSVGFFLRRELIPQPAVAWIAARLAPLFRPAVAVPLLGGAAIAIAALGPAPTAATAPRELAWGYAWMIASLVAHELGHASAAAAFGCRPGGIGFTFYVIYPALYSDVTAAWTLRRYQRVVVDLGGVYFQVIAAAALLIAGAAAGVPGTGAALWLIAVSVALTLHPFLKFDGYWIVADALGVPNLAQQRARALAALVARLTGRAAEPLPWGRALAIALTIYAVAATAFAVGFAYLLIPAAWRAAAAYPDTLARAADELATRGYPHTAGPWLALATSTVILYFALHLARRVALRAWRALHARAPRPRLAAAPPRRSP